MHTSQTKNAVSIVASAAGGLLTCSEVLALVRTEDRKARRDDRLVRGPCGKQNRRSAVRGRGKDRGVGG